MSAGTALGLGPGRESIGCMSNGITLLVLLLAAVLEAGGDALMRSGLRTTTLVPRLTWFISGGLMLFAYGYTVNAPPWDFGRLLGVYVVLFFAVAQLISWLVFHQAPTGGTLVGGVFVVIGGVIMSVWA